MYDVYESQRRLMAAKAMTTKRGSMIGFQTKILWMVNTFFVGLTKVKVFLYANYKKAPLLKVLFYRNKIYN